MSEEDGMSRRKFLEVTAGTAAAAVFGLPAEAEASKLKRLLAHAREKSFWKDYVPDPEFQPPLIHHHLVEELEADLPQSPKLQEAGFTSRHEIEQFVGKTGEEFLRLQFGNSKQNVAGALRQYEGYFDRHHTNHAAVHTHLKKLAKLPPGVDESAVAAVLALELNPNQDCVRHGLAGMFQLTESDARAFGYKPAERLVLEKDMAMGVRQIAEKRALWGSYNLALLANKFGNGNVYKFINNVHPGLLNLKDLSPKRRAELHEKLRKQGVNCLSITNTDLYPILAAAAEPVVEHSLKHGAKGLPRLPHEETWRP